MILGAVPTGTKPPLSITESRGTIAQLLAQQFRTEDGTGNVRVHPSSDSTKPLSRDQYFEGRDPNAIAFYAGYTQNWSQTHPNPGGVMDLVRDATDAAKAEMGTGIPWTWILAGGVAAYFFFTRKP